MPPKLEVNTQCYVLFICVVRYVTMCVCTFTSCCCCCCRRRKRRRERIEHSVDRKLAEFMIYTRRLLAWLMTTTTTKKKPAKKGLVQRAPYNNTSSQPASQQQSKPTEAENLIGKSQNKPIQRTGTHTQRHNSKNVPTISLNIKRIKRRLCASSFPYEHKYGTHVACIIETNANAKPCIHTRNLTITHTHTHSHIKR